MLLHVKKLAMRTAKFNMHTQESKDSTSTQKTITGKSGPRYRPPASNCSWLENSASLSRGLTAGTGSWALSGRSLPPLRTEIAGISHSLQYPQEKQGLTLPQLEPPGITASCISPDSVLELVLLRKTRSSTLGTELTLLPALWCQLWASFISCCASGDACSYKIRYDTSLTCEASCSQLRHVGKSWLQPSSLTDRLPCVLPALNCSGVASLVGWGTAPAVCSSSMP